MEVDHVKSLLVSACKRLKSSPPSSSSPGQRVSSSEQAQDGKFDDEDVGIVVFSCPSELKVPSNKTWTAAGHAGTGGLLKGMWSDFWVSELDAWGSIVWPRDFESVNVSGQSQGGRRKIVQFSLVKTGWDTMSAVSMIARKLNIRLSKATSGCCGLKDKGALTCQKVTINSQQASSDLTALMGLNKQLEGIKIADVELVDRMLRYGEHSGNRFTILLRNITVSNSRVFDAVKRLRRFGFVNYFGHQRFGTGPVPSTEVGRLLLGKRWREAGEEVMSTKYIRRCHSAGEAKARQIFVEQGNASAALDVLPFTCEDERCILEAFATSRNVNESLRQAFSKLARADLWRQAYTSLVWNRMATKRLMEYDRRKAVVGDLVAVKRYDKTFVDVVKEEDVAAGRYSIAQVVLPVFARNKKLLFPKNAVGSSARASLQADGLSFEEVDLEASKAPFPLDDSVCPMRFLIMNCSNLSMKVVTYRSPADVLYDEMLDSHLNSTQGGSGQGKSKSKRAQEQQLPFKGLILSFSLPPNSFATMAVREITREGTHPSVHDAFRDEVLQRNADDAQAGERRSGLQPVKKQHKGNRRTERRKKLRRKAAISRELVKRRKRREPAKSIRRK